MTDPNTEMAMALDLLDRARSDPVSVIERGVGWLEGSRSHDARSTVLRGLSIAARMAGTMAESIEFGRRSVEEGALSRRPVLLARARMTLAGSLAIAGENAEALSILDAARDGADEELQASILSQEGAIRHRLGELQAAMTLYLEVLPLFRALGDRTSEALTLNNLAMLQVDMGDMREAEANLIHARELDLELGHDMEAAGGEHNLGIIHARNGDIPGALESFAESERRLEEVVGGASEVQVSRVEVLLSAGLVDEARALASSLITHMNAAGLAEDEAEAYLVGAQAALSAGEPEVAVSWASNAAERFEAQRRWVWAENARLVAIQGRRQSGSADAELAAEAGRIAAVLEAESQFIPAFDARLVAGLIHLDAGDIASAVDELERVAGRATGPIEIRIQALRARALIRLARGDRVGAERAARAGIGLLDDFQAALGATDVRSGVERHGAELGRIGLRLALESRNPRRILDWMERTRARALRHPPVIPDDDDAQAADLAELRRLSIESREAVGPASADLAREAAMLQARIRDRARTARGTGPVVPGPIDPVAALGERTLVELASVDGVMSAVVVRRGRRSFVEIGPEGPILGELESLRFTMRRLAVGRGRATIEGARLSAERLDRLLLGALRLGDAPVVIVPTPALHATPWWVLPALTGRPFTICPSAELWVRAGAVARGGRRLVVAGPDLSEADAEVDAVGALDSKSRLFGSGESLVEEVVGALDRAGVAHFASHARFEVGNPMFSSLRLADGDLYVYDLERLGRVPGLVILSACDSGFSESRPGAELMGLASAFLTLGTGTLVASVGLVPDSTATRSLMVRLHRGLIDGDRPSEALAAAQQAAAGDDAGYVAAASFVCIGAG